MATQVRFLRHLDSNKERTMKNLAIYMAVALSLVVCSSVQADPISLSLSSNGLDLSFDGSSNFTFVGSGPGTSSSTGFKVNGIKNGAGDSLNDLGFFTSPTPSGWKIGTVTGTTLEKADVTGTGMVTISDGALSLTGTLIWKSIETESDLFGQLDIKGLVNVSTITYSGTQSDLKALAAAGSGVLDLTFVITPSDSGKDLNYLKTHSDTENYVASLTAVVPEPSSMVILAIGGILTGAYGLRRRKLVQAD
jgi:hypothetical protein